ncbi:hypothetical protein GCM10023347_33260 [Streptomyces chumphonensis]
MVGSVVMAIVPPREKTATFLTDSVMPTLPCPDAAEPRPHAFMQAIGSAPSGYAE